MQGKPKLLFCYICGREFGTTSLTIHLKNCSTKFTNEQSKKQSKDRIPMPTPPDQLDQILSGNLDDVLVQSYNQKAVKTHKYQVLPKCRFCDRTFNEESLKAHENGCSKKGNGNVESKKDEDATDTIKKPKTLTCCICGRDFGLTSLKIHYPQCYQKFVNDEKMKPESERKDPPQFSNQDVQKIKTKISWTLEQIEAFNNEASKNYREKAMIQCGNCGRRFIQQSYQKHKKNCTLINGKKDNQQSKPALSAEMRSTSTEFKKPRTLQCCVCGREFGLTSLKIHYPQCIDKFNNQEMKKPKADRKQTPSFSEQELEMISNKQDWSMEEIQAFNNRANANYRDNAMVQCQNCGRKFIEASYFKHKKNCQLINGVKASISSEKQVKDDKFRPSSPQFKKPRTLTCCVCGREFGLFSLKIHYPQCLEKFATDEKKKPKDQRKTSAKFTQQQLEMINNKTDWTLEEIQAFNQDSNTNYRNKSMVECENCGRKFIQQSYLKHKKNCSLINGKKQGGESSSKVPQESSSQIKKPKVLMCHICGRQFGLASLSIHLPQCAQKFQNQEKKKELRQRKPLPIFPESQRDNFSLLQSSTWPEDKIDQYNQIAQEVYRSESLSQCPICGRKFFQQSLPKHLKHCQKNKEKKEESVEKKSSQTSGLSKSKSSKKLSQGNSDKVNDKKVSETIKEAPNQETSKESTPKKEIDNDSFLKKELYRKIQTNNIQKIVEAQEGLEQTLLDKTPLLPDTGSAKEEKNQELHNKQSEGSSSQIIENKLDDNQNLASDAKQIQVQQQQLEMVSPKLKTKSSKGFAAPRKKEETIQANMKICKICSRKFTDDKIEKHEKICLESKQRQKKSEKNLGKAQNSQESIIVQPSRINEDEQKQKNNFRDVLSPEDKIRLKKGFAAPRQKESQSLAQMAECRGCKRKFASDRIEKHQSVCKLAQEGLKQPFIAGSYKKIQQVLEEEKTSIKRFACPKCNRKFAEDRLEKHVSICKATVSDTSSQMPNKFSTISKMQKECPPKIEFQEQAFSNVSLQGCKKCGRKFNSQRISKHQEICKGTNQKKPETVQISNAFKKQKSIEQTNPQLELKNLEIKSDEVDNRLQCSKCFRKFAPDRLQKHVNICKAIPPLSNAEIKPKIGAKPQLGPLKDKLGLKYQSKSPKLQQKQIDTIGEDQYIENQLQSCMKCCRKFAKERLAKHLEVCKGEKKLKAEVERANKNVTQMKRQTKIRDEEVRRTKNQFFHMMKDLKCKKIKDEEIEKQLDEQLLQINGTHRVSRKQNVNASNSDGKKKKETVNKSVNLPKI